MKTKILAILAFSAFVPVSVFAMQGCTMGKKGDMADVIGRAATELKASNPELSAKLQKMVDDCCELGLHKTAK